MMLIILSTVLLPVVFSNRGEKGKEEFCELPPFIGHCNEKHDRWYYDPKGKKCRRFVYSGCGGNENKFITRYLCEVTCSKKQAITKEMESICSLPKVKGPCDEKIPRWYYNPYQEKCQKFKYSGCGANKNNFVTRKECHKQCDGLRDVAEMQERITSAVNNVDSTMLSEYGRNWTMTLIWAIERKRGSS